MTYSNTAHRAGKIVDASQLHNALSVLITACGESAFERGFNAGLGVACELVKAMYTELPEMPEENTKLKQDLEAAWDTIKKRNVEILELKGENERLSKGWTASAEDNVKLHMELAMTIKERDELKAKLHRMPAGAVEERK